MTQMKSPLGERQARPLKPKGGRPRKATGTQRKKPPRTFSFETIADAHASAPSVSLVSSAFLESLGSIDATASNLLVETYVRRRTPLQLAKEKKVRVAVIQEDIRRAQLSLETAVIQEIERKQGIAAKSVEWTPQLADRRSDLIDREIAGTLTLSEAAELQRLQLQLRQHRHEVAPLPLQALRDLHKSLMAEVGRSDERRSASALQVSADVSCLATRARGL